MSTATATPARTRRNAPIAAVPFRPAKAGLTHTWAMARFVARRNWLRMTVWAVVVAGMAAYVAVYYQGMFTTQKALDEFAAVGQTPSMEALTGSVQASNTLGGAVTMKIWMTLAVALMIGVVFLVTRNGRADEEAGRTELLRSRVLGIHGYSVATYAVVAALCLVIGLLTSLAVLGTVTSDTVPLAAGADPAAGAVAGAFVFGFSIAGLGLLSVGIAALAGQLASTGRGANALGAGVIGVFYLIRMSGDLNGSAATWVSPIGWGEKMHPYGDNVWWPLILMVALGAILLAAALVLEGRRDHTLGMLPDRPGPAGTGAFTATPVGLGMRLERGAIIGWSVTVVLAAAMFGSVIQSMSDLLKDAGGTAQAIIGGEGVKALLGMLVMMIALVVTAFALQTTMQLRTDEAGGTLESQLAGSLGRIRWAAGRLAIPVLGSLVLLAVGGAIMGAVYGASVSDASQTAGLIGAAVTFWPAVLLLVGVGVALFGWVPRLATPVTWGLLGLMLFLTLVGDAMKLPKGFLDAMPFQATPHQPMDPMNWAPVLVMAAVAVVLFAVGLYGFRRRDLQIGG